MSRLVPPPEHDLQQLLDGLDLDGPAELVYERGDRDSLHVWLLWDGFEGLGQHERDERIRREYRKLPGHTLYRITLWFPMTHAEFLDDYQVDPGSYGPPVDDEANDGPFLLRPRATAA